MVSADYAIAADADGVITIIQRGFWTPDVAHSFTGEADIVLTAMRAKGKLRLIIDARELQVPGAEVSEALSAFDGRIRRDGDRVAMLVGSSLLKMQMKRKIARPGLELFVSADAARGWVVA